MNAFDLSADPDKTVQARVELPTFIPLRLHKKKDGRIFPVEIKICYFELKGRAVFLCVVTVLGGQRQRANAFAERTTPKTTRFRNELSDILESFTEGGFEFGGIFAGDDLSLCVDGGFSEH
jgi:hypothetical protein